MSCGLLHASIYYLETSLSTNSIGDDMIDADAHAAIRALASDRRLLILQWLKAPGKHFRPQTYGDLVDGRGLRRFHRGEAGGQPADREQPPEGVDSGGPAARETNQAVDVLQTQRAADPTAADAAEPGLR